MDVDDRSERRPQSLDRRIVKQRAERGRERPPPAKQPSQALAQVRVGGQARLEGAARRLAKPSVDQGDELCILVLPLVLRSGLHRLPKLLLFRRRTLRGPSAACNLPSANPRCDQLITVPIETARIYRLLNDSSAFDVHGRHSLPLPFRKPAYFPQHLGGENIRFVLAATVVGAKPAFISANDQIGSLKNGSVSSVELVESAIARICGGARITETSGCGKLNRNRRF
jgi:hypothetical protein